MYERPGNTIDELRRSERVVLPAARGMRTRSSGRTAFPERAIGWPGSDGKVYAFGKAESSIGVRGRSCRSRPEWSRRILVVDAAETFASGNASDHGGPSRAATGEQVSTHLRRHRRQRLLAVHRSRTACSPSRRALYGNLSGTLKAPIVPRSPTRPVTAIPGRSDGGVFSFGDAEFHGSTGKLRLNRPVVGISPPPTPRLLVVASDGGVFAFERSVRGSMGRGAAEPPGDGLVAYGNGYLMVARRRRHLRLSRQAFLGSLPGVRPPRRSSASRVF